LPKLHDVGAKLICGVPVPVPVNETLCGDPDALSEIDRLALRLPIAEGVKVTDTVQFPLGFKLLPQLFVCEKSPAFVPVISILLIVKL